MKIGVYSPYFDAVGGGERYMLSLASVLAANHSVDIIWDDPEVIARARESFGIDLLKTKVVHNFFREKNIFKKLSMTRKYDLIIFLSDGSIPISLAKHTILHFQVPVSHVSYNALKMSRIDAIVCNSQFTLRHLDRRLKAKSMVIYPPVDTQPLKSRHSKEHLILSVGRFHHLKKQDILIDVFKNMHDSGLLKNWKLIFAGSVLPADREYLSSLRKRAKNLPVMFEVDAGSEKMRALYGKSSLYWHAAGFKEHDPVNFEHFGIAVVEAMASGTVPLVFCGGGLPEIITNGKNGYLWKDTQSLSEMTMSLVNDSETRNRMAEEAVHRSSDFDRSRFDKSVLELVGRVCG